MNKTELTNASWQGDAATQGGGANPSGATQTPRMPVFIALVAGLSMLGQFAVATYLPAFSAIADELHANAEQVQQSLTAYFLPFALMMLWHGAISDAVGRRRIILVGLMLFMIGSLMCAAADSIAMFYAGRVVQGLSGGIGVIVGRTMVRDLFAGTQAQKLMTLIAMIFVLAPAVAPVWGGWLLLWTGWRGILVFVAVLAALQLLACWRWLPETLPPARRHSLHPIDLAKAYATVFADKKFMALALTNAAVNTAIYVYVFGAPHFITKHLGLSDQSYGWLFIPIVLGLVLGGAIAHRVADHMPPWRCVAFGHAVMLSAGVLNIVLCTQLPAFPWALLALLVYSIGLMLTQPSLQLLALDCVPHRRGLASSCYMTVQQAMNTLSSAFLVPLLVGSTFHMALGMAALQLFGVLMFGLFLRHKPSLSAA